MYNVARWWSSAKVLSRFSCVGLGILGCRQQPIWKTTMTLDEYFAGEPKGAKVEMAEYLGITANYLSMLIHGKRQASPKLAMKIEIATQGLVTRRDLLPELYAELEALPAV
jgi:DNA-binding transcriptional regulator YdaS (Cro superfamily)